MSFLLKIKRVRLCCTGAMLTLTDKVEGGRGVWEAAQGDLVMFEPQSSSWKV